MKDSKYFFIIFYWCLNLFWIFINSELKRYKTETFFGVFNNNFVFPLKAVESLSSASSGEEQEVTTVEKHTKVNYTKQEYIESTVRETKEVLQHVTTSVDEFLVSKKFILG